MTRQVVIHVSAPWERFHRRPLIEALSRVGGSKLDILIVDRPLDLVVAPIRRRADLKRWLREPGARSYPCADNMRVLTPFVPIHEHLAARIPFLATACERLLRAQIDREMPRLPGTPRVEWIYYPEQQLHLHPAGETLALYECYDEYNADPAGGGGRRRLLEDTLLRRSDLVLATASELYEARRQRHPNIHLIPNAVDYAILSEAQAVGAIASEVAALPEPRIGFLGYFNHAVDLELIEAALSREPSWSWVFIGPPGGVDPPGMARLRAYPNAHFLGFILQRELAPFLRGLSVGVIPFKTEGAYNQSINPLKLYEYMAAGLPIVSTTLREVARFSPPVLMAEDLEAFLQGIRTLASDAEAWQASRLAGDRIARRETWEERARQILALIEEGACRA
jgi:glycosyltransferase involved in cell wall biosynthesis